MTSLPPLHELSLQPTDKKPVTPFGKTYTHAQLPGTVTPTLVKYDTLATSAVRRKQVRKAKWKTTKLQFDKTFFADVMLKTQQVVGDVWYKEYQRKTALGPHTYSDYYEDMMERQVGDAGQEADVDLLSEEEWLKRFVNDKEFKELREQYCAPTLLNTGVMIERRDGIAMLIPAPQAPGAPSGAMETPIYLGSPVLWEWVTRGLDQAKETSYVRRVKQKVPMGSGSYNVVWCFNVDGTVKPRSPVAPSSIFDYLIPTYNRKSKGLNRTVLNQLDKRSLREQWNLMFRDGETNFQNRVVLRVTMKNGRDKTENQRAALAQEFMEEYLLTMMAYDHGFGTRCYLAGRFREPVHLEHWRQGISMLPAPKPCDPGETINTGSLADYTPKVKIEAPPPDGGQDFYLLEWKMLSVYDFLKQYRADRDAKRDLRRLSAEILIHYGRASSAGMLIFDTKPGNMVCDALPPGPAGRLVPNSVKFIDFDMSVLVDLSEVPWSVVYFCNVLCYLAACQLRPGFDNGSPEYTHMLEMMYDDDPADVAFISQVVDANGFPALDKWESTVAFWREMRKPGVWERHAAYVLRDVNLCDALLERNCHYWVNYPGAPNDRKHHPCPHKHGRGLDVTEIRARMYKMMALFWGIPRELATDDARARYHRFKARVDAWETAGPPADLSLPFFRQEKWTTHTAGQMRRRPAWDDDDERPAKR